MAQAPQAQDVASQAKAAPQDTGARLQKLKTMLDQNLITQEDYARESERILDGL